MITFSKLIRWSGMAFFVSGILLVVATAAHPDIFESTLDKVVLGTPWWVEIHVLLFLSTLLELLGAAGLYLAQIEKAGVLGLVGLLSSFVGLVAMAGMILFEAFLMPPLAAAAPATLSWEGPLFRNITYVSAPAGALYLLGFVALGIATFRAGVFSRWGALLLALGVPATAVLEGPFVPVLGIAATVVLAAGEAWLGYELWTNRSLARREEQLAAGV